MRLMHGTFIHPRAVAMVLTLVLALGAFAPGSPLVSSARAAMACETMAWGGRTTDTVAWGTGRVICTGTAGSGGMQLLLEHCEWDFAGACLSWSGVLWLGSRSFFGPGYWYLGPKSGAALNNNIYHVVLFSQVQSTATGIIYQDTNTTTQWRQ